MAIHSFSKLKGYRTCKRMDWLLHVKKAHKAVPGYVRAGAANHRGAEAFLRHALTTGDTVEATVAAVEAIDIPGMHPLFLERFASIFPDVALPERGEAVGIEEKFALCDRGGRIENGPSAFFAGIADYEIYGRSRIVVTDWKTGWDFHQDDDREQVLIYLFARWQVTQMDTGNVRTMVVRPMRGIIDDEFHEIGEAKEAWDRTVVDCKKREKEVLAAEEEPEATTGAHCADCWVRASCTAYQGLVDKPECEDPAEVWAQLKALEERVGVLKQRIRFSIETQGPLEIDGRTLDIQRSPTVSVDAKGAWSAMKAAGIKPEQFFAAVSLSKTNLRKVVRDKALRDSIINEHGSVRYREEVKLG